ncbi:MAG TPA: hypothetical protein VLG48_13215 [Candidatus Methylomirabilis sp.]|nr:hypothetical protein [Candidatus Methylomirabilis sp.]
MSRSASVIGAGLAAALGLLAPSAFGGLERSARFLMWSNIFKDDIAY